MVWLQRWCSCLSGNEGSSERYEIGTNGLLGILGRLSVSGVRTSTTCVCSAHGRTGGHVAGQCRLGSARVWSRFSVADFRAPQPVDPEVGEWTHGWQFHSSVARDTLFATSVHLPPLSTDHRALRASQRGPCASRHFSCLPTCLETDFSAEEFRTRLQKTDTRAS